MIPACDWNAPGHDPYQGTFVEWVARTPIGAGHRAELAALVARNEYTDVVYIDRDSIRSANPTVRSFDYAPHLTTMAFGGKGRVCQSVSRAAWAPTDLQGALVFCTSDNEVCVARPSVCNNWSLVERRRAAPVVRQTFFDAVVPSVEPPAIAFADEPRAAGGASSPGAGEPVGDGRAYAGGGGGGIYVAFGGSSAGPVIAPPRPAPVSPVPEPPVWAAMALAGALLACMRRLRAR